jgi:DNA-directed RNA polymerase subunit RPC12/RpoP
MSVPDKWSVRIYKLPCAGCGEESQKSFIELEINDRLRCDHCGVSINVTDYYGTAELDAIAKSLGSDRHILRQRKKGD